MRAAGAMSESIWNDAMALTSALIFDDSVYLSEALNLPVNQSEDELDAELALRATESGIQDPFRFLCPPQYISRALSTMTAESANRSSISLHSRETESTSFTSAPSRTSRDQTHSKDWSPTRRVLPKSARASVSVEQHDTATRKSMSGPKTENTTFATSVTQSALSSTSSLQQQQPRKKRASNLFSLFRKDSSSCSSQAHHGHHGKSRGTRLECGHTLSTVAIHVHIQEASNQGPDAVPNCCGIALPRAVLEGAKSKEETKPPVPSDENPISDLSSLPDSGYSENGMSAVDLPRVLKRMTAPAATPNTPNAPPRRTRHQEISVDLALANEAFSSFKVQQREQFERVATFEYSQRKALSAYCQYSLKRLTAQHETSKKDLTGQHTEDLERLEERQISTEHDLRETQAQEAQNVATALKHMEAYCLGTNANHPEHTHTVTQDDFQKLDRQRFVQTNLPRKHENAINVLRARQERDIERKMEKQETELEALDVVHLQEKLAEEANHRNELERLESVIAARRKRLLQRWDLRFEMWRRDWEGQHFMALTLKLEHEEWPARKAEHVVVIPETSELARYVRAER